MRRDNNNEIKGSRSSGNERPWSLLSAAFVSTFTVNVMAEWGDKSQLSVILLAARGADLSAVMAGALVGHVVTNALAVAGGSAIRDHISVRTGSSPFLSLSVAQPLTCLSLSHSVTLAGGVTFLAFALLAILSPA